MNAATLLLLLECFSRLDDPRSARSVRHPFAGMVVLMLLARIREMEVLVRWATVHWDQLQGPLGFDRDNPPCRHDDQPHARQVLPEVQNPGV